MFRSKGEIAAEAQFAILMASDTVGLDDIEKFRASEDGAKYLKKNSKKNQALVDKEREITANELMSKHRAIAQGVIVDKMVLAEQLKEQLLAVGREIENHKKAGTPIDKSEQAKLQKKVNDIVKNLGSVSDDFAELIKRLKEDVKSGIQGNNIDGLEKWVKIAAACLAKGDVLLAETITATITINCGFNPFNESEREKVFADLTKRGLSEDAANNLRYLMPLTLQKREKAQFLEGVNKDYAGKAVSVTPSIERLKADIETYIENTLKMQEYSYPTDKQLAELSQPEKDKKMMGYFNHEKMTKTINQIIIEPHKNFVGQAALNVAQPDKVESPKGVERKEGFTGARPGATTANIARTLNQRASILGAGGQRDINRLIDEVAREQPVKARETKEEVDDLTNVANLVNEVTAGISDAMSQASKVENQAKEQSATAPRVRGAGLLGAARGGARSPEQIQAAKEALEAHRQQVDAKNQAATKAQSPHLTGGTPIERAQDKKAEQPVGGDAPKGPRR